MCCLIYKFLLILTQKMQISFLKILPENALKFVSKKMRICVKNFAQLQTAGAILGGVFGITSFIQCFGMSQFGALLLGINPFLTFLVCVPTRILMGWLTGLIYHGLRKTKIPSAASVTIASLCCPLLNTTSFMGTLVTLFASTMRESFGMGKVLPFIFAFVGVNGVVEAIVCFVVGTAISMALKKALRYS